MDINQITMTGRLTRDPEIRFTPSSVPVCSFSIAVDIGFGDKKRTIYPECVAWRHTAEFVNKYAQKGSAVVISAMLDIRDRTDKDGNKRRNTELIVSECKIFNGRKDGQARQSAPPKFEQPAQDFGAYDCDDSELPF